MEKCGNSAESKAGFAFYTATNISILNCTSQHSAVSLFNVHDVILIDNCNFVSNGKDTYTPQNYFGGLFIIGLHNHTIHVTINGSNFYNNGCYNKDCSVVQGFGLYTYRKCRW